MKVTMIERIEVIQIRWVSGFSKSRSSDLLYNAVLIALLIQNATTEVMIIRIRITKIQTRKVASRVILVSAGKERPTASTIKEINATPVTPYVSKPSAVGPTLSPALSPQQSAITPGLRGSSSPILNTTFIKSDPMSAILVKIPPAIRSADAPSDSPMAKPMKQAPALSPGIKIRMISIMMSSTQTRTTPILIPAFKGICNSLSGLRSNEENAIRLLANVFILMPNQATPYEPRI